jgi:hypothetical protein
MPELIVGRIRLIFDDGEWPARLSKDQLSDVHRPYGWLGLWNRVAGEIALLRKSPFARIGDLYVG